MCFYFVEIKKDIATHSILVSSSLNLYNRPLSLWRVRLVVRTQPSQGWRTGSTPVRARGLKVNLRGVPLLAFFDKDMANGNVVWCY